MFFFQKITPYRQKHDPPKKNTLEMLLFPEAEEELSETENLPDSDFEAASGGGATHRTSPGCWLGWVEG